MNPSSTRTVSIPSIPVATPAVAKQATLPFIPLARPPRASNANGTKPATASVGPGERAAAVERLYKESYDALLAMALLRVDHMADAKDAVHEAVFILLSEPHRKVTRSVLGCIVRDVCREQYTVKAAYEEFVDDAHVDDRETKGSWLERALRG